MRMPVYPLSATKEFCIPIYLGVRTVFTDHSLFGFEDAASILTNKLLAGDAEECRRSHLCISYWVRISPFYLSVVLTIWCEENTVLRGELFDKSGRVQDNVYVIPNALVPRIFSLEHRNPVILVRHNCQ